MYLSRIGKTIMLIFVEGPLKYEKCSIYINIKKLKIVIRTFHNIQSSFTASWFLGKQKRNLEEFHGSSSGKHISEKVC